MASKTRRTEIIRRRKKVVRGKKSRAVKRNKGTTRTAKELFGE